MNSFGIRVIKNIKIYIIYEKNTFKSIKDF